MIIPGPRFQILLVLGFAFIMSACSTSVIVATTTPSPPPDVPTTAPDGLPASPVIATSSPGATPTFPVYTPQPPPRCQNAPATRLIINLRGRVMDDDPRPINVRNGPGTDERILGRIEINELFLVLEGPVCADDYAWYRIRSRNGLEGWLAEGDRVNYYVEPYMPG